MKPINEMTNAELVHHVKKDLHPVYRDDINQLLADRLDAQSKREAELVGMLKTCQKETWNMTIHGKWYDVAKKLSYDIKYLLEKHLASSEGK